MEEFKGGSDGPANAGLFVPADSYNWGVVFGRLQATVRVDVKLGVGGLDGVTLSGLSFYDFLLKEGADPALRMIVENTYSGPLSILFDGAIADDSVRKAWLKAPRAYDNKEVFNALCKAGRDASYYAAIDACRKKYINAQLSVETICKVVRDIHTEMAARFDKQILVAKFGSVDNFVSWWIAKNEFCYLYTHLFIQGCQGNQAQVGRVLQVYHNYYKDTLPRGEFKCLLLDPQLFANSMRLMNKECFCTALSFLVDTFCCCGGGLTGLVDHPGNALVGQAPNSIKGTSFAKEIVDYVHSRA
jgi:hypothetical protein